MTPTGTPRLVLGVGARARGTTQELSALIRSVLERHDLEVAQVGLLTTLDRRSDHVALVAVAHELAVPVEAFGAETLAVLEVPAPSEFVLAQTGTSGVAEAAVLAAGAQLIVNKQSSDNFTVAVGRLPATRHDSSNGNGHGGEVTSIDLGHHGDTEVHLGLVDFAVNVAVPAPPPWLRRALDSALDEVARYPNVAPAVDALARLHGCPPASILVTNGAAEAFTLIARARRWRKPLVVHPQFTEPESALQANGYAVTRLVLGQDSGFALDPAQVPADADLVVIGNPTNPTSRLHRRAAILGLVRPGRLVVVDEAFMDVVAEVGDSVLDDAIRCEGLVVVRSLTKTFGLAGIRAGYLVGTSDVIAECALTQPPWSVNTLAVAAVVACTGGQGQQHARAVSHEMTQRLSHLVTRLTEAGLDVVPEPAGPFVLAHHPQAAALRVGLRRRGIAVRRGDTFPGLGPEWLRIAAREPAMTDSLLAALAQELKDLG